MRKLLVVIPVVLLAVAVAGPVQAQQKDIVDTAVAAGTFKTLAKLLTDADLVATMKGPGPYTVFAPTDEAFAKVPKQTLEALAKDKAKLQAVLKYHVLAASWTSDDLKLVKTVTAASDKKIAVASAGGTITVNGTKVVKADIKAANGVIHVVDAVLMPPQ